MIPGFESLGLRWRQQRFNPLRSLTPERLTAAIDQAAAGWLREFALILEEIEKRDAICRTVLGKRKAAVCRQPWDVVISKGEEENPEAQAHKETLEHFYNNLTVTDATDLNVRSGMAGLLRQMMDAVMQRYAVHEIVWKPTAEGLGAELRRVPIYFFENRSGRLRYIGPETRSDGTPLEEGGWMTTVADSVGEAIAICYMFRRLSVQDWVAFSEKFSIPGVVGRTSHAKGTPEGDAFANSVAGFGSEWVGVFYNDDGTMKSPIEIIATAAGSTLPQKEMAEYMDRLITVLVRGGDLGTLSRQDSQGASLQGDETAAILADDCAMVSETLQTQLDPLVIRLVHGDVKPLAHVEIAPPADEDVTREIGIDRALAALGVRQRPEDLAERYGRTAVQTQDPETQDGRLAAENEAAEPDGMQALRNALAADLQPLGDALYGAYQAADEPALRAALKKISEKMPELAGDATALGDALAVRMAEAFAGGAGDETAAGNAADRGMPIGYFFAGGARRPIYAAREGTPLSAKGQSQPLSKAKQAGSILAAIRAADAKRQGEGYSLGRIDDALAERIFAATDAAGEPRQVKGMELRIDSDFVAHARRFHPNLTEGDFLAIPSLISAAPVIEPGINERKLPTVNFRLKRGHRDFLVVGVQLNKQGQLSMNTLKKSAEGKTL